MSVQSFAPKPDLTDRINLIQMLLQEIVWQFVDLPTEEAAHLIDEAMAHTTIDIADRRWVHDELLRQLSIRPGNLRRDVYRN